MLFLYINRAHDKSFEELEVSDIIGITDLEDAGILEDQEFVKTLGDYNYSMICLN